MTDIKLLTAQAENFIEGGALTLASMANISSFIFHEVKNINWAGFYLWSDRLQRLVLGPFCGKAACTLIDEGRGVCGTALKSRQTEIVDNVHSFRGHIVCDSASLSEIVVPLYANDIKLGVFDIDSPVEKRFGKDMALFFENIADLFVKRCGDSLAALSAVL
jgi:L-methionine (R)-S-oxide reductase